jgi:O-acetyl-ADP-ribose deacetylase (regulator of RNase III)
VPATDRTGPGSARDFGPNRLELTRGDITRERVDAIVNAANSSLLGGGGVDGAIHRAGGPAILDECRRIVDANGPLPAGDAVITSGGLLPARRVIHTVGPRWRGGEHGEAATLARCYRNSLALAAREGLSSVAFPSISTGAYGFPVDEASVVSLGAVAGALRAGSPVRLVRFVLFSDADLDVYRRALAGLSG